MAKISKTITIDDDVFKKALEICDKINRNFSNYVEYLLKKQIDKYKK